MEERIASEILLRSISMEKLNDLTKSLTAFSIFDELLNAGGSYRPSLCYPNQQKLANYYDAGQYLRGDSRRAFRG